MIHVTLNIVPVAKGRARVAGVRRSRRSGQMVPRLMTPAATRSFEKDVAALLRKQLGPTTPRQGPVKLTVRFYIPPIQRPKHPVPFTRPDLDNYLKAIKDAANGILWTDDGQVQHVDARKLYALSALTARIEIEVSEVTQPEKT